MNSAPSAKESRSFSMQLVNSDNNPYTLKFAIVSNKLEITLSNDDSLSLSYKASFQIEDLHKLNKFFRQYDSVEEALDYIVDIEKLEEKIAIITEGKFIKLKIAIPTGAKTKNNQEIEMMIPAKEVKDSDLLIKLCQKAQKISMLEKKINYLFDYLGISEKDLEFYEKIKDSVNHLNNIESSIITKSDFGTVAIGIKEKLNKKIKEVKLLYRASRDGDQTQFHTKCDGRQNTVTFVKATNGRKFGGFANQAFNSNNSWISDKNCFVFSLNYHECYYYNNNGYMIYGNSSGGPYWGSGNDLYLGSSCRSKSSSSTSESSFDYKGRTNALCGGSSFQVEDYETYELVLE